MQTIITKNYKSPFGELIIGSSNEQLCICDWKYRKMRVNIDARLCKALDAEMKEGSSDVISHTIAQLTEYFNGIRERFDLPLLLVGTEFQKRVWQALIEIPYGETKTYLSLSRELGDEKAIRAVATANGANCISIIIPCHRIIGSNGKMIGYAGGIQAKKKILDLERKDDYKQSSLF